MTWSAADHYDAKARPGMSARQAIAERAAGPSAAVKRYHNDVKRRLIDIFATDASRYLDVACGRGGDIFKWIGARVRFVRGVDVSPREIDEARSRFAAVRPRPRITDCVFETVADAARWSSPDNEAYDAVACMFAIHYFFGAEDHARSLFATVSASLEIGGVFFGVFPDGRRVLEAASSPSSSFRIEVADGEEEFGREVSFEIPDTVIEGGSREFLVLPETLVRLAVEHGLEPIAEYDTGTLLDPRDRRECVRHLAGSRHPVSALYATFAFIKR